MWVLGINGPPFGSHDAAACLVDSAGRVVAFSEEERFSRDRHAVRQPPRLAVDFCLRRAGITLSDVDVIATGWDMSRLVPAMFATERDLLEFALGRQLPGRLPEIVHVPHHAAHAASAFHSSLYDQAAVLVVDGNGEDESATIWEFREGAQPRLVRSFPRHQSLGWAYDAASRWLGLSFLDAGKTMGLAAFGRAAGMRTTPLIEFGGDDYRLLLEKAAPRVRDYRSHDIVEQYHDVLDGWRAIYDQVAGTGRPRREVFRLHEDEEAVLVAYTAQTMVEEGVGWLARQARETTGLEALCLAGGVALNCSANALVPQPVYVPPVPHDAGVALGAAWWVRPPRERARLLSPYLGADLAEAAPASAEDWAGLRRTAFSADRVAELLLAGQVGAVAEGRAEIGPRALGHRSILALPRPAEVHLRVNRIKNREPWRPFGPVAGIECAGRLWTDLCELNRYMLGAAAVTAAGRETVPAAVHVDGTTRPQLLRGGEAPVVEAVLDELEKVGAPRVLINTSFNGRGEPIVNGPAEALRAFRGMDLDFLVLGDELISRC
ncbi:carbamoyltransferase C-terminal domain-containing protein [Amycolatopsis vastitatis]|uniref:Carbamoyltransferase n=1 Tax=Amycolatopsis vastitatis TaxID=1905142 RepID=A0A229TEX8_9PSEU|nr:carbamoyltransferase C-terminal domain-containing protein [Amycolatopsis vastitatis]OXM69786.1 carbamoyltransferase [Amycolatopsis vastitatis]